MSIRRLVMLITFLAVFAMAARPSLDSDTWWHLRAGQWIVENHSVPQVDPFSYTRLGASWQYPGWLVEAPMYLIYEFAGPAGLNLMAAIIVTLAFAFLYRVLSGGVFLRAFVIILGAAASAIYWAARPHLVTFLMAAIFLSILERYRWRSEGDRKAERLLWWLPVLMVIWANSHGGFIVGFVLVGIYSLDAFLRWFLPWITAHPGLPDRLQLTGSGEITQGELDKTKSNMLPLLAAAACMLIAVCINPSGPVMLLYPFKTVSIGALSQYIQEWQPPNFHSMQVQPFVWLFLLTFGAVGFSHRRLALTDFLLFAGFAYLSLNAARNIALFALAALPVLSRHAVSLLEGLPPSFRLNISETKPSRLMNRINWGIVILLVLAVAVKTILSASHETNLAEIAKTMPAGGVNYIKNAQPPGMLFNSYNWGGYLLFELPDYPVFIDGRTDLYDDRLVDEWLQIVQARPGWQEALKRWGVNLVLVEPGVPLVSQLEQTGWRRMYQDPTAVVYQR